MAADGDRVYARLTVTGTNTGRSYEVNMFDYAGLEDGRIVERIQQSDTLSQLGQTYGGPPRRQRRSRSRPSPEPPSSR